MPVGFHGAEEFAVATEAEADVLGDADTEDRGEGEGRLEGRQGGTELFSVGKSIPADADGQPAGPLAFKGVVVRVQFEVGRGVGDELIGLGGERDAGFVECEATFVDRIVVFLLLGGELEGKHGDVAVLRDDFETR